MVETDRPLRALSSGERPGVWDTEAGCLVETKTAMATSATGTESSVGPSRRTIESGRFERACTEAMGVRFTGPSIADVHSSSGQTYEVELESGVCECRDYQNRGDRLICKHVQRAALAALFDADQRVTEVVARVAAFARDAGCQHEVRGCAGPTAAGPRGLPCQSCIDAAHAPNVDEFTVWSRLVGPREAGR